MISESSTAEIVRVVWHLPAEFRGCCSYRSTDAMIYCVVEGKGTVKIGDTGFTFDAYDVLVAPSWAIAQLSATAESAVFSYSDRPVLSALNLLREERS